MPGYLDASGGELVGLSASSDAAGCKYANCPAATATTVKNGPGLLKGLWVGATGTAGTVTIADGGVTIFVAQVAAAPAAVALALPPEGLAFSSSLVITTAGTGVTAAAFYL